MKNEYVSPASTLNMEYVEVLNHILLFMPHEAGYDMMKFLCGTGQ